MMEIFEMAFMQRAVAAGVLVGALAGYYGAFIVQRKMSFLGSGLGHAAFGGVALGLLLKSEPLWFAAPFTILVALLITYLKEKTKLAADTAIGILFSVSVALGIIFISMKSGYSADAFSYLFGSILAVKTGDLIAAGALLVISAASFLKFWGAWAYETFDVELAKSDRLPVSGHDYLLSVLISLSIVASIKMVGIMLIASYLVIPAAAARLASKTFIAMTIISVLIGALSSIAGLVLSYVFDLPSGAVIILTQGLIFLAIMIAAGAGKK